jgi:hypothetical protein
MKSVYSAVRTGSLNKAVYASYLKDLILISCLNDKFVSQQKNFPKSPRQFNCIGQLVYVKTACCLSDLLIYVVKKNKFVIFV